MESRHFCVFTPDVPINFFLDNTSNVQDNIKFTAQFWQPFIDVTKEHRISGPLFGALIEISRALNVR